MNLEPYRNEINLLQPQPALHISNHHRWLTRNWGNPAITAIIGDILAHLPVQNSISRGDIIFEIQNNQGNLLKGFLMVLMWGYAGDNRGPYRASEILQTANIQDLLTEAYDEIGQNNLEGAFNTLNQIKGINVSFISKFLYFCGKAIGMPQYPLIFDTRVAKSIVKVISTDTNNPFIGTLSIQPRMKVQDYINYVSLMHGKAVEFHNQADRIELFLFNSEF